MTKKITSALISVFYKDGLETLVQQLHKLNITIYSTGGTQQFIEKIGIPCVPVETLTTYPSILGGRVKTLHPAVFGGILGRRDNDTDIQEMRQFSIPVIDLVIVDLYPFEETLAQTRDKNFSGTAEDAEKMIVEKIDIGGPSMIRAAAKNFKDVTVIASKADYAVLDNILADQGGSITLEQRKRFAAAAFETVAHYDFAIHAYFNPGKMWNAVYSGGSHVLRYGENPHQHASFYGDWSKTFSQLHGKELSYNNLVDVDAAIQLIREFNNTTFAIIKHTNVCGIAGRSTVHEAWNEALAGDPESAFGGVLVCNSEIDNATALAINEIFFEVLIAPSFSAEALTILQSKKNRILLQLKNTTGEPVMFKSLLNGVLEQSVDEGNTEKWEETGARDTSADEKQNLLFANLVCKHLKSNAIALVKNMQLIGKGCGQTSRVDALRQAIAKANQFGFSLEGACLASDAFFPFDDCIRIAHAEGVTAIIQPGGSIRDKDSIAFAKENNMAMVITGMRHFKH